MSETTREDRDATAEFVRKADALHRRLLAMEPGETLTLTADDAELLMEAHANDVCAGERRLMRCEDERNALVSRLTAAEARVKELGGLVREHVECACGGTPPDADSSEEWPREESDGYVRHAPWCCATSDLAALARAEAKEQG